ncbi:hypothetical protein D3C85_1202580 [compost metagenome]
MDNTILKMTKTPDGGFKKGHLLSKVIKGKTYDVLHTYGKNMVIINEDGDKIWITQSQIGKYFSVIEY